MNIDKLTPRQKQILDLTAKGMTADRVALVLECSPKTVRNQLTFIYDKLGVDGKVQAVACYIMEQYRDIVPIEMRLYG